jgi:predicted nuclease with RNAse H fold
VNSSARSDLANGVAVGIDVAAARGCDVVALSPRRVAVPVGRVGTADGLRTLLADVRPDIVAIDAPLTWARPGCRRSGERALAARGISLFATPDAARGEANPFYAWMRTGFEMFAGAAPYPTLETFPHATAVAILGCHPPRGLLRRPAEKREWRLRALDALHVDTQALRTQDHVDAALCAVTGLCHLTGDTVSLGDPTDGVITIPVMFGSLAAGPGTRPA